MAGVADQALLGMCAVRPDIAGRKRVAGTRRADHAGIAAECYGCRRVAVATATGRLEAGVVGVAGRTDCLWSGMVPVCRKSSA